MFKNKFLPLLLVLLPITVCAQERNWKDLEPSRHKVKIIVDLNSIQINRQTSEVTYWVKNINGPDDPNIASQVIQMRVNCKKNTVAFLNWISYKNKNWQGEITYQGPFKNQTPSTFPKPIMSYPAFAYLCSQ